MDGRKTLRRIVGLALLSGTALLQAPGQRVEAAIHQEGDFMWVTHRVTHAVGACQGHGVCMELHVYYDGVGFVGQSEFCCQVNPYGPCEIVQPQH